MNRDDKEQGGWEKGARQEGKGNDEAGEMAGERGGSSCPSASLFLFQQPTSQRENHTLSGLDFVWRGVQFKLQDNSVSN